MRFTNEEIVKALADTAKLLPASTPPGLAAACPGIDKANLEPAWPIRNNLQAVHYMLAWNLLTGTPTTVEEEDFRLTHAHAGEFEDLAKYGPVEVYRKSIYTKYVSVSWHLAGRYTYDNELIEWLTAAGWPSWRLIDFGAAPWVQALYYAAKGLDVTVVNSALDSDCHNFGRFLAQIHGYSGKIKEYVSEDLAWTTSTYDVVYSVDALEHIPPLPNGRPGWLPYATHLYNALRPAGVFYANAPLEYDTDCHPVSFHPVHYTSPLSLQSWCEQMGMPSIGKTFLRLKSGKF